MRVGNGAVNGTIADIYTRSAGTNTRDLDRLPDTGKIGIDRSTLSNMGELVGLARNLFPADRLNHLQAIASSVNTGDYQADPAAVSQALVDEHLNS